MAYFLCPYPKFYCLCSFLVLCSGRKSSQLAMSACFSELTDIGVVMRPSLLPWHPKNFSSGSWHIRLLRKAFTPGTVKRYFTSSTNDATEWIKIKIA